METRHRHLLAFAIKYINPRQVKNSISKLRVESGSIVVLSKSFLSSAINVAELF